MCGIAGLLGEWRPGLIQRMNKAQRHRGPDGEGIFEDKDAEVALGHVRLAILDLSDAGAQPMSTPDGRYTLVYNGEIYNYQDLGEDLRKQGCRFRSTSDTEVLLYAMIEWGKEALGKFNGIFAFAFYDKQERKLLLARDPLGVKPLYLGHIGNGRLLFASEIKALCAHPHLRREPDFIALQQHLAYCHASGDRTALRHVKRLPPGHYLTWDAKSRRAETTRYWSPPFGATCSLEKSAAIQDLKKRVRQECRRQMVSDVAVGSLLSGGLDSSLVSVLANEANPEQPLECYSITYPREENRLDMFADDAPYARQVANRFGLPLTEISPRPTVTELWPKLIYHLDEPIADPAAITSYLICKRARENNTIVLLSGQGADELFCGYPRYWVMQKTQFLDTLPLPLRHLAARMALLLPGCRAGKTGALLRRTRRVLSDINVSMAERFLSYCANTPQSAISSVLSPEFRDALDGETFMDECLTYVRQASFPGQPGLQNRDLGIYLPNHNLLYTDKTSMAVGVEARVPLLGMQLSDCVPTYPENWQVRNGETKHMLRAAARGIVPDSIIDRPKAGFGAPYRKWLREDLADMWHDLTSASRVNSRGWFSEDALRQVREKSQNGKEDLYMLQWAIMTIELWAETFIDSNPAEASQP